MFYLENQMENISNDLVQALKSIVFDCNWQNVGDISQFKELKCYKLYSIDEIDDDILFIKDKNGKFYACESRCSHEGGPLEQGDIEELNNELYIVCPWHSFDFNLKTGISSTGLKQNIFDTKLVNNDLYINTPTKLSLEKIIKNNATQTEMNNKNNNDSEENVLSSNENENSISFWASKILNTADPKEKCKLTFEVAEMWKTNQINTIGDCTPPDQPKRKNDLITIDPSKIKRGKGGTIASRIALLHSLANIEQWAIDLSWDIICRFGPNHEYPDKSKLPNDFFTDFIKVACDEAKHFDLLEKRLIELGSYFGALPIHNGLWQSATETKDNFMSRLAILHMVHEARGLDVHPQTRLRFLNQKDDLSVKLLDILYQDEITHVACGLKWFEYSCKKYDLNFISTFHDLVKKYFNGYLKPPFDTEGRLIAGMHEKWYLPLIKK